MSWLKHAYAQEAKAWHPSFRPFAYLSVELIDVVNPQHDLGIAGASERKARITQLTADLEVVVDLSVEDSRVAAIDRCHGLVALAGQIDDREPPVAQRDTAVR